MNSVQLQQILLHPRSVIVFGLAALILFALYEWPSKQAAISTSTSTADWIADEQVGGIYSSLQSRLNDVYNSSLGFEKVFVVSLPERTDHRDTVVLTSALTGFNVEFIDGLHPSEVPEKAMPPHPGIGNGGARGAWRGHMNTMRKIISENIQSALIAEEDFDWDVRLKEQLKDFSMASNGVLSQFSTAHVPHYGQRSGDLVDYEELTSWLQDNKHNIRTPQSPYGDGWDVLWLGNCGVRIEPKRNDWQPLVIQRRNDPTTVPPLQYYSWDWDYPPAHPYKSYPNHTRLYISQATDMTCTIAYAVSQKGARKILFELGIERADMAFDLLLKKFCEGDGDGGLAEPHACWSVLPSLFDTYRAAGPENKDSDIAGGADAQVREQGFTLNIQKSVRVNARKLLSEQPGEIRDQYPYSPGT